MATSRGGRVTLVRALSKLGVASRVVARGLVVTGRVRVDGRAERDPELWVDPDRVRIEIDGEPVRRAPRVWYAVHKPRGVVTTCADELGRATVRDLLPPGPPLVAPVGRLDLDSSGLLLATNDTRLAARISAPESRCRKVYEVLLDRPFAAADSTAFAAGMLLDDRRLRGVQARVDELDTRRVELALTEGRNRQIRRMCAARGLAVVTLHRIAIGPIALGALPAGACRALTEQEIRALEASLGPRGRGSRAS